MKEIRTIVQAYQTIDFKNTKAALATVVRVEGSSYRRTGARMLVLDNGNYLGGISGGCLEGDTLRRAQKAIMQNKSTIITYDTTQDDAHQIGVGLGCNGIIDVLITPLNDENDHNPIRVLKSIIKTRVPVAMVSIIDCDDRTAVLGDMLTFEDDNRFLDIFPFAEIALTVLQDVKDALKDKTSRTVAFNTSEGTVYIFIEIILPSTQLIIYGSNYDVYPLLRFAKELGWETTVITNLARAGKMLFEMATKVLHNKATEEPHTDGYTAILLMSHDYKTDLNNLQKALDTNASYIGMLGPRKRSQKMFEELAQEGIVISGENRLRIFSPAGLDIGAATPEEIALSITAEISSHFAGRQGTPLRLRQGPIYDN